MTRLVVISPEGEDAREVSALLDLCEAGLERYHLRKPHWSVRRTADFLEQLGAVVCARVVLHQHFTLAEAFQIAGLHEKDSATLSGEKPPVRTESLFRSRACHTRAGLESAGAEVDAVLFSPVFPSISKVGCIPGGEIEAVGNWLRARRPNSCTVSVFALGGIDETTIPRAFELGFDGVAALGAVWRRDDPLAAFRSLQHAAARAGVAREVIS